jgi:hypothetical protein
MGRTARPTVVKYLRDQQIPYKILEDKNILVMKANSRYHYCVVEFFGMPQEWYDKQQYFKFKRIFAGQSGNSIIIKLNEYLYEDTCREVNYGGESTQEQISKA